MTYGPFAQFTNFTPTTGFTPAFGPFNAGFNPQLTGQFNTPLLTNPYTSQFASPIAPQFANLFANQWTNPWAIHAANQHAAALSAQFPQTYAGTYAAQPSIPTANLASGVSNAQFGGPTASQFPTFDQSCFAQPTQGFGPYAYAQPFFPGQTGATFGTPWNARASFPVPTAGWNTAGFTNGFTGFTPTYGATPWNGVTADSALGSPVNTPWANQWNAANQWNSPYATTYGTPFGTQSGTQFGTPFGFATSPTWTPYANTGPTNAYATPFNTPYANGFLPGPIANGFQTPWSATPIANSPFATSPFGTTPYAATPFGGTPWFPFQGFNPLTAFITQGASQNGYPGAYQGGNTTAFYNPTQAARAAETTAAGTPVSTNGTSPQTRGIHINRDVA